MVVLQNIPIILLYISILGQVQAAEPKAKVDGQIWWESYGGEYDDNIYLIEDKDTSKENTKAIKKIFVRT